MESYEELNSLNLQGWECFQRKETNRGYLYSFQKKDNGRWLSMSSLFNNIETQIKYELTDSNDYVSLNHIVIELNPIILN